jgi:hypothetical protein
MHVNTHASQPVPSHGGPTTDAREVSVNSSVIPCAFFVAKVCNRHHAIIQTTMMSFTMFSSLSDHELYTRASIIFFPDPLNLELRNTAHEPALERRI